MSILNRIHIIRENERFNKSGFEKAIGKSNGYLNTAEKSGTDPSVEVLLNIKKKFPQYNLEWLLTGEGSMTVELDKYLKNQTSEPKAIYEKAELSHVVIQSRDIIRGEMKILLDTMNANFEVVGKGIKKGLMYQTKVNRFIDDLQDAGAMETLGGLNEYLKKDNV